MIKLQCSVRHEDMITVSPYDSNHIIMRLHNNQEGTDSTVVLTREDTKQMVFELIQMYKELED